MFVALFTIGIGVLGIVFPDTVTSARRQYFSTPVRLYAAAALRVAMGLVVILSATYSRTPKTLRLLGALMCLQGLSATILGPERARAVLEFETMHPAFLRAGALVAVASGCLFLFAAMTRRRPERLNG